MEEPVMAGVYAMRQWKAAYYQNDKKKWIYGDLMITPKNIQFMSNTEGSTEYLHVVLSYDELSDLKKGTTGLFYSALVVSLGNIQHWFSSLPSREAAYNTIWHFWKERLIPNRRDQARKYHAQTKRGAELLQIAKDCDDTLTDATVVLQRQGEQLNQTFGAVYDIHNDLDVSEVLLDGIESWLGKWKMPKNVCVETPEIISIRHVPLIVEYPVIYENLNKTTNERPAGGSMRVSKDGITILHKDGKNVHHFSPRDISEIRVISPWEVVVTRFMIGQSDVSYNVMCTRMVELLKMLQMTYGSKLLYEEPPEQLRLVPMATEPSACSQPSQSASQSSSSKSVLTTKGATGFASGRSQQQAQVLQSDQVISDADAEELAEMLSRLRHMAVDAGKEVDLQNENIDALSEKVETANARLKKDTARINKLL